MAEQVFYDIARWRLDEQLDQIRELNARFMGVFTGATAILVLFGALQDLEAISTSGLSIGLASAAVGVYVALLLTALIGYRDPEIQLGPSVEDLNPSAQDEAAMQLTVALAMSRALTTNRQHINRKSQLVFLALLLWAVDALLLLATALTSSS